MLCSRRMQNCQTCGKAIIGDEVLYTADAKVVCPGCFDTADVAATASRGAGATKLYAAGAITAMVPFMFHVSESSTVMVNGEVVSATSRDYFALACGAVAALLGAIGMVGAARSKARAVALTGWVAVIALGAYQIAHGLGAV
jgi:2-keto-3-deoxy-6-phosphogluconate aldolase